MNKTPKNSKSDMGITFLKLHLSCALIPLPSSCSPYMRHLNLHFPWVPVGGSCHQAWGDFFFFSLNIFFCVWV